MVRWQKASALVLSVAAVVVAVRCGVAMSAGQAPAGAPAGGTRIAVVNIDTLVNEVQESVQDRQDAQQEASAIDRMRQKYAQQLHTMQQSLNPQNPMGLKGGTPDYERAQNKLLKAQVKDQIQVSYATQKFNLGRLQRLRLLYQHINEGVAAYAKQHNIQMVISAQPSRSNAMSLQQLESYIGVRQVLYAQRSMDITSRVKDYINAQYRRANPH